MKNTLPAISFFAATPLPWGLFTEKQGSPEVSLECNKLFSSKYLRGYSYELRREKQGDIPKSVGYLYGSPLF